MSYVFRGTVVDIDDEPIARPQRQDAFSPEKCGTYAGYRAHQHYETPACDECKAAKAEYHRTIRRATPKARKPKMRNQCATYPGYMRHKRGGEEACGLCKNAYAQYMRDYRDRKRVA